MDERNIARFEKISFDSYNGSDILTRVVERYHERTKRHLKGVLADKIYRNHETLTFCKQHSI